MACPQIKLSYCAQCHQIGKETVYNLHWLNKSLCNLKCLKRYQSEIALECDLCNEFLKYNRIYLRTDVPSKNGLTFICVECVGGRSGLAVNCVRCEQVCYKGHGAQNVTTSGLIPKFLCSENCNALVENRQKHSMRMKSCSICGVDGKYAKIIYNGLEHGICSAWCLISFENSCGIHFGNFSF